MSVLTAESTALDAATWPVFLVDGSGRVSRPNAAASEVFGPKVEGGSSLFSTLWTNENGGESVAFLEKVRASRGLHAPLKLRGKGITILSFNASVCAVLGHPEPGYLFQLFPAAAIVRHSEGKSQSVEI